METTLTPNHQRLGVWARYLGAVALLAVGVDHIVEYYADYYREVPTIGPLFLLNFISAVLVAVALALPTRRIAGRFADRLLTILAVTGIGIAGGSIAALVISENGGLFGFSEQGYRGALVLAIALEAATVLLLAGFLALRRSPRLPGPKPRRARRLFAGTGTLVALVVAGCGGGGGYTATSTGAPVDAGNNGGAAALHVTNDPQLGEILVDAKGRTLYDFVIDKGTSSVCYGACASLWPPYTTKGAPVAGKGVKASLIGTAKRRDGAVGVTYAGHPLYYYAPDQKRGQISGQALDQFGAPWYALAPSGREIHTPPS